MPVFWRFLFSASIIFICLCIILPVAAHFMPLEFTNKNEQYHYESIRFFGLPIAIILTLAGMVKKQDNVGIKFGIIILTVITSFAIFYITGVAALSNMCRWSTEAVLFESKIDSDKIVMRSFGCGATDSGRPTYSTFKVKNFSGHFIWVTPIDTTKINQKLWKRIEVAIK